MREKNNIKLLVVSNYEKPQVSALSAQTNSCVHVASVSLTELDSYGVKARGQHVGYSGGLEINATSSGLQLAGLALSTGHMA